MSSEKRNTPNWTQSILRVHHIVYQSSPTNRSPFAIYEHLNGFGVQRALKLLDGRGSVYLKTASFHHSSSKIPSPLISGSSAAAWSVNLFRPSDHILDERWGCPCFGISGACKRTVPDTLLSNCQITGLDDHRWGVIASIITDKATLLSCRKTKEKRGRAV